MNLKEIRRKCLTFYVQNENVQWRKCLSYSIFIMLCLWQKCLKPKCQKCSGEGRRYRRKKGNDEVGIVRPSEEISPPSKIKLVRKFVQLTFFVGLTFWLSFVLTEEKFLRRTDGRNKVRRAYFFYAIKRRRTDEYEFVRQLMAVFFYHGKRTDEI